MATLTEKDPPEWEVGIYRIECSDHIIGGEDGISNRQAKQLANRTSYLKNVIETSGTDNTKAFADVNQKISDNATAIEKAQSTANTGVSAAATAQDTANTATNAANEAQITANQALALATTNQTNLAKVKQTADSAVKRSGDSMSGPLEATSYLSSAERGFVLGTINAETTGTREITCIDSDDNTIGAIAISRNSDTNEVVIGAFDGDGDGPKGWDIVRNRANGTIKIASAGNVTSEDGFTGDLDGRARISTDADFAAHIGTKAAPANIGATDTPIYVLNGEVTTCTETVGGPTKPVYMKGGQIAALGSDIGRNDTPVYMEGGVIKACGVTANADVAAHLGTVSIGSNIQPMYLTAGSPKASNATVGTPTQPIYMQSGEILASETSVGSGSNPIYMASGVLTSSNKSIGADETPVYMKNGEITATTQVFASQEWVLANTPAIFASTSTPNDSVGKENDLWCQFIW